MVAILKDLGIDRLSLDERINLMNDLWESILDDEGRKLLSDAKKHELQSRLAEHVASPDDVVPWEQIKTDAEQRFQR